MGGTASKQRRLFGTVKITGEKLYAEGVVIAEPGQVDLGRSPELKFWISSIEKGKFTISARYLGAVVKEVAFSHEELITLVQDSEASTQYKELARRLGYARKGTKLVMARAFSLNVTKLLPYLYEQYDRQDLADQAETLVQEKQLARLRALSHASKKRVPNVEMSKSDPTINDHVRELKELERRASRKGAAKGSVEHLKAAAAQSTEIECTPPKKDRWMTPDGAQRSPVKRKRPASAKKSTEPGRHV
mmetsp:Transcript_6600/g.16989  ORF Transcript_6600/g.16989 Transcript_6600/m.16989 type:complete len:247 (-) Transcript_6600:58-798(-)